MMIRVLVVGLVACLVGAAQPAEARSWPSVVIARGPFLVLRIAEALDLPGREGLCRSARSFARGVNGA